MRRDASCSGMYVGSREAFVGFRIGGPRTYAEIKGKSSQKRLKHKKGDNGEEELTKEVGGSVGPRAKGQRKRSTSVSESATLPLGTQPKYRDQGLQA